MRLHYAAFKARLLEDAALATAGVNDTALVDSTTGLPIRGTYTILFGGAPDVLDDGRLSALQFADSDAEYVYTVRSVSTTADGVRSTQTKVGAQMIGHRLIVAGRSCRIEQTHATDVDWDKSVKPPLLFADQEYTVYSSRV
jgi:hypothetical protein